MPTKKEYIKNPVTKRVIRVGGQTYKDLLKTDQAARVKRAKRFSKPDNNKTKKQTGTEPVIKYEKNKPSTLKKDAKRVPPTRKALREHSQNLIESKGDNRGSKTRGWSLIAPQRGRERNELMDECGGSCFLIPEKKAFPVCPSLRSTQGKCKVDCRGIQAAKIRANQWKYPKVANEAEKLQRYYGC